MSNDINGISVSAVKGLNTSKQAGNAHRDKGDVASESKSGDAGKSQTDVRITDTASRLHALESKIADQPVVDSQRVERIKKAVADGTYKIDASRTAENMAKFENLLASKAENK
jgi:negative regulator of flagellin synthesis FlgM